MFTEAKIKQLKVKCLCVESPAYSISSNLFPCCGHIDRFFFDLERDTLLALLVGVLPLLFWQQHLENRAFAFSPAFFLLTGAFFVLLGSYRTTRIGASNHADHFTHFYNPGDLVGVLLQKRISEKKGAQRFQARMISSGSRACDGKIFVKIETDSLEGTFFYGDTLWTKSSLYPIRPPSNPGAFDFRQYAARKHISHQLYLKRGEFVRKPGNKSGLLRSSIQINRGLQRVLDEALKEPGELSVAKALLLGDRNEIPEELLNSFKGAGAMHILAISGLHVGIVHLILMFLTRPFRLWKTGKVLRVTMILLGLWCYALLTGLAVSAIRSVSMFTLLTLGQLLNRRVNLLNNLVNSAFVLLLLNPMFLFDVGFQLSYSALTGIAAGAILIERKNRREKPESKIRKYFWGLILVSCSAQFGVMPLSLYYFKQFSGLFLVSSILLIPVLGITLILGYTVIAASFIFGAQLFIHGVFQVWLKLITTTIEWLGSIDQLILKGAYFPFSFLILLSSSLILLTLRILKRNSMLVYASGMSLICMQAIWAFQRIDTIRNERLVVFHSRGEPLVVRKTGPVLELKKFDLDSQQMAKIVGDYTSQLPGDFSIQPDEEGSPLPIQFFQVQKSLVCVIDDDIDISVLKALGSLTRRPDIVILSEAPRINLERLLKELQPEIVVADGSNHNGFVRRCEATCHAHGIEFHATYVNGAFLYPK